MILKSSLLLIVEYAIPAPLRMSGSRFPIGNWASIFSLYTPLWLTNIARGSL